MSNHYVPQLTPEQIERANQIFTGLARTSVGGSSGNAPGTVQYGQPTIMPSGQVVPGGPQSTQSPADLPGILTVLGAIYSTMNKQAEKVPGVQKAAGVARSFGDQLRGFAEQSQISELEAASQLYDFFVPQDAAGVLLAAFPPARVRNARNFRYFHGTSPEMAKKLIDEGFQSGQSALLRLEGTSLSRDPNVSLHRFASDNPAGLVVVDVPPELQAKTRHMNVEDFVDTKRLIENNPSIQLYNKPSTLYKELETFVRRSHVPDESGQLGLFRPTDELKARKPTPEEERFALTVSGNVAGAHYQLKVDADRLMAAYNPHNLAKRRSGDFSFDQSTLSNMGPTTPQEVISGFRRLTGSGSNTERARALQTLSDTMRQLPLYVSYARRADERVLVVGAIKTKFGTSVVLRNGKPTVEAASFVDPKDVQAVTKAKTDWWNGLSDKARIGLKQWDTPRGRKLIEIANENRSGSLFYKGKSNIEHALDIEKGVASGQLLDAVNLRWRRLKGSTQSSTPVMSLTQKGLQRDVYLELSEADLPTARRLDENTVQVGSTDLVAALRKTGKQLVTSGIKKREQAIKVIEELAP